jgi:adenosylcobinamide kinase/adenosylcobinamide-phosphate guanylyltransferase
LVVMITGGARSGKSLFAERYAASLGTDGIYIATAEILDEEMRHRVQLHKDRRTISTVDWETREAPYDLANQLHNINCKNTERNELLEQPVILVDCLTIWLSNWLLHYEKDQSRDNIMARITELVNVLSDFNSDILLVTNEVGSGIVPEYPLGRQYRDLAGFMNQQIAEISRQVFLVTAGIPLELKSNQFKFEE